MRHRLAAACLALVAVTAFATHGHAGPGARPPAMPRTTAGEQAALIAAARLIEVGRRDEGLERLRLLALRARSEAVRKQARFLLLRAIDPQGDIPLPEDMEADAELGEEAELAATARTEPSEAAQTLTLIGSTLCGAAIWGPMAAKALESERGASVGAWALTTAAGFGVPYALTQGTGTTWGQATLTWHGATRGLLDGALLSYATDSERSPNRVMGIMLATSTLEAGLGHIVAGHTQMSPGVANAIGMGHDLGMFWSVLGWLAEDPDDLPQGTEVVAGTVLAGSAIGAVGGLVLADSRGFSWGDAENVRTAALVGTLAGLTVDGWFERRSDRRLAFSLGIGSATGVVVGTALADSAPASAGGAMFTELGTLGAAALCASFFAETGEPRLAALLCSGTAFGLLQYATRDAPETLQGQRSARTGRVGGEIAIAQ